MLSNPFDLFGWTCENFLRQQQPTKEEKSVSLPATSLPEKFGIRLQPHIDKDKNENFKLRLEQRVKKRMKNSVLFYLLCLQCFILWSLVVVTIFAQSPFKLIGLAAKPRASADERNTTTISPQVSNDAVSSSSLHAAFVWSSVLLPYTIPITAASLSLWYIAENKYSAKLFRTEHDVKERYRLVIASCCRHVDPDAHGFLRWLNGIFYILDAQ